MVKLVRGIGINDGSRPASINGRDSKEYSIWQNMLDRCTKVFWVKKPSYTGTTCSENFKNYSFFYDWCQTQIGFRNIDSYSRAWQLDKDLLFKGNKHYSETTCVFVPHRINLLLTKRETARGCLPIGVTWNKECRKYAASVRLMGGKRKYLGVFKSQEAAFEAYKVFKEGLVREVAAEYKEQIDCRAYQALIAYKVSIDD